MRAIDTNILARAFLRDDARQTAIADKVLQSDAFVSATVLLETGWLLRSRYKMNREAVAAYLLSVIDLPNVTTAHGEAMRWAVRRSAGTGDLADLIHLADATTSTCFLTFDNAVAKAAGADAPLPVETLG